MLQYAQWSPTHAYPWAQSKSCRRQAWTFMEADVWQKHCVRIFGSRYAAAEDLALPPVLVSARFQITANTIHADCLVGVKVKLI